MLTILRHILARWEDQVGHGDFFAESRDERLARVQTDDAGVARELLEDARHLNDGVDAMAEGVERRATTLQGVVSIAATVAIAGGALLLDPSKIQGAGWRIAFVILFGSLLYCLIATAYRATQSSTQVQIWTREDPADYLNRTSQPAAVIDSELTTDMLYGYGRNIEVVRWKVSYMRAASEWFLRGLIILGLIAGTFCAYVGFHGDESPPAASHRSPLIVVHLRRVTMSTNNVKNGALPMPKRELPSGHEGRR